MHQDVYQKLKELARAKKTTNYTAIGQMIGLDMKNPADRNKISEILDEINHYEHQHDHPMISAIVIRQDINMPGEGFFKCSHDLGKFQGEDKLVFWVHELCRVHKYWQSHYNKK